MKLENTKVIAVFVVPILIIAGVVGYHLYQDEDMIRVDEGFAEIWLEEFSAPDKYAVGYENISVTTTTYINNNSYMEFVVNPQSAVCGYYLETIDIELRVKVNLSEDLDPGSLRFHTRLLEANNSRAHNIDFSKGYSSIDNGTLTGHYFPPMATFKPNSNRFEATALISWLILPSDYNEPATMEVTASLDGFSEEVLARVHIHLVRGDDI